MSNSDNIILTPIHPTATAGDGLPDGTVYPSTDDSKNKNTHVRCLHCGFHDDTEKFTFCPFCGIKDYAK